jgi:predicted 3-demethylubiquinone-9 3-methyltransferase (glyoxalase superfamily)
MAHPHRSRPRSHRQTARRRPQNTEAFSFQIATGDQEETEGYWKALVADGGAEAQRAFGAMMTMGWIDVAAIDTARSGEM